MGMFGVAQLKREHVNLFVEHSGEVQVSFATLDIALNQLVLDGSAPVDDHSDLVHQVRMSCELG